MDSQRAKDNLTKSRKYGRIEVVMDWLYTDEASPDFKRLMKLLLEPRNNQSGQTSEAEGEHRNEQA